MSAPLSTGRGLDTAAPLASERRTKTSRNNNEARGKHEWPNKSERKSWPRHIEGRTRAKQEWPTHIEGLQGIHTLIAESRGVTTERRRLAIIVAAVFADFLIRCHIALILGNGGLVDLHRDAIKF